jgi:hypothetical protein
MAMAMAQSEWEKKTMKLPEGYVLHLEPQDEYNHEPEAVSNYNESMYFNVFDPDQKVGGWFRLGNRPNEGYAEMSVCAYLPDGRIAFMYKRPQIESNQTFDAGGMKFEVVEPFERLRVTYQGEACLLANPFEMAHPSRAFKNNPLVPVEIDLDYHGLSPMFGGETRKADGSPVELDAEKSFGRAHYEQHVAATGAMKVGEESWRLSGYGVRDKSWGPRYWQAIHWYRWLPMNFGPGFGMMISIVTGEEGQPRPGGMVFEDGQYHLIEDARVEPEWDENFYQTALTAWCRTAEREYTVEGKVLSLIPLRNRRQTPDGSTLLTRITEGMTEYRCDDELGYGLSEFLDQIVDGKPVGLR